VVTFVDQRSALVSGKCVDVFEVVLVAGNQRSIGEELSMLWHAVLFSEGAAIGGNLQKGKSLNGDKH